MRLIRALVVVLMTAGPGFAQDEPVQQPGGDLSLGQVRSPVLTIDPDRLFTESLFGQRVTADLRRDAEALDLENQRIEAALTEEERSLTERRPTMPVEAFRLEAEDFDARVQGIRRAQDAKERSIQEGVAAGRSAFLDAASPILAQIMIESGAAVILDRRSVFLGVGVVDITDKAIAAIDVALGDGTQLVPPEEVVPDDGDAGTADPVPAP